jgi:hypothetical protein
VQEAEARLAALEVLAQGDALALGRERKARVAVKRHCTDLVVQLDRLLQLRQTQQQQQQHKQLQRQSSVSSSSSSLVREKQQETEPMATLLARRAAAVAQVQAADAALLALSQGEELVSRGGEQELDREIEDVRLQCDKAQRSKLKVAAAMVRARTRARAS